MIPFLTAIIEHPIIVSFLLANLAIGFWAHTKAKANSFEDYALASRSLPTGVLVMTLLATFISSGTLVEPDGILSYGVSEMLLPISFITTFLCIGTFIAPYLVHCGDSTTLGDLMGTFYGPFVQLIAGLLGCIASLLMISSQINAMGVMGQYLLGIDSTVVILFFGGIVVLYSTWGGIRSVSYTDILQLITAMLVISWIVEKALYSVEGISVLTDKLLNHHADKLALFSHSGFNKKAKGAFFWGLSGILMFSLPIVQRMLVTRDKKQIRRVWYISSFFYGIIAFMLIMIGFVGIVAEVKFDVPDESENLLLYLVRTLMGHEKWMIELAFVGLLGILLSTMDSYLHAVGISFVQDVITPIRSFFWEKTLNDREKRIYGVLGVASVGILALVLAVTKQGIFLQNRALYQYSVLISGMITTPLVIGIIGFKTNQASWISFSTIYLFCIGILNHLKWDIYDYFLVAMPSATLAYFITHIYINGGIVMLKRSEQTVSEQLWLPSWQGTMKHLKDWLVSPLRLHILAGRKIVSNPAQPLPFSMLIFALYTFSSVMTGGRADIGLANFMAGVHVIGITLCCGLMLEGIWPDKLKPYFALYWFVTLFYCLPLGGTLAFLRVHGGAVSVILWVSSFAVLAFLVDSNTFCLLSVLGVGISMIIWRLIVGYLPNDLWNDSSLTGAGILVLMVISILLFSRSKEKHSSQRLNWNRTASSILGHDLRNTANMLSGVANVINSTFKMSEPAANAKGKQGYWIEKQHGKFLEEYAQKLTQKSTETKQEIKNFMGFMKQQVMGWLEQEKMNMHKTVKDVVASMKDNYARSMEITISCPKDFEANVFSVFPNVIANLIKNASVHGQATKVTMKVDGVKRTLIVRDNGKGISADVLPRIFDLNFTTGDKGKRNAGVGLAFVKMIMNASSGKISCHSRKGDGKSFTEFVMTFPEA